MEFMGIDLKKERGFTVSTINKIKRKDLLKLLHRAINKTSKETVEAIIVGECIKDQTSYSRHFHIVFSRDLSNEEKTVIKDMINKDDRFIGNKKYMTKWGINNDNGYIFTSEDHSYWNKVKIY